MNLRITYQTPEGGVAVIIPTADCGLTIEQIAAKDVPAGIHYKIVDVSAIPSDRTFRNAWEHCPVNGAKVNVAKAKVIHLDRLRELRAPKLSALDIAYQRADELGDAQGKRDLAAKKQALRDVTKAALPDDLASLKDFIPDILK
jgi:predicted dinucleotide-utilizing enzyme